MVIHVTKNEQCDFSVNGRTEVPEIGIKASIVRRCVRLERVLQRLNNSIRAGSTGRESGNQNQNHGRGTDFQFERLAPNQLVPVLLEIGLRIITPSPRPELVSFVFVTAGARIQDQKTKKPWQMPRPFLRLLYVRLSGARRTRRGGRGIVVVVRDCRGNHEDTKCNRRDRGRAQTASRGACGGASP